MGILSKMCVSNSKQYFTQNKAQALNLWMKHPEDIEMTRFVDGTNGVCDCD